VVIDEGRSTLSHVLGALSYPSSQLDHFNQNPLPTEVYHYTDAAGLNGILKSGTIFATDFRYLNDSSEIIHIFELATKLAKDSIGSFTGKAREFVERVAAGLHPEGIDRYPYFLASFSTEPNDLSQWRAYGGSQGYALKFPGDMIIKMEKTDKFDPYDPVPTRQAINHSLLQVIYDAQRQEDFIKTAFDLWTPVCEQAFMAGMTTDERIGHLLPSFHGGLSTRSTQSKHPDFHSEKEWRLVMQRFDIFADQFPDQFRIGSSITPCVEFKLYSDTYAKTKSPDTKLPLLGVRHGPSVRPAETKLALDRLLNHYKYREPICERTGSDTPARLWEQRR
jgi:hypothetical protein